MTALHVRRSWDGNLGDLPLTRIFELLADAPSFARCRAVCKSWRAAAATLDDRPATRAALSTAEDEDDAAEDIVRACMSHSFEPTHGMLFVGLGFDLTSFAERVLRRMPRRGGRPMPLVACLATGLVGPDATTGERRVVTWKDPDEDDPEWQMSLDSTDDEVAAFAERLEEAYECRRGAVLVLGRAPGVVVDAFRARRGTPTRTAVDYIRGPEEMRPPRGTPPRDMAVILGSHALDVDALDRRLAESSRAPPRIVGGLAAKLPNFRRWDASLTPSLYATRADEMKDDASRRGEEEARAATRGEDDLDMVGLRFRPAAAAGAEARAPPYRAVGGGGLAKIGPRYVIADVGESFLPTDGDGEMHDPFHDAPPAPIVDGASFMPLSHVTAVPDPSDREGVAAARDAGGTYAGSEEARRNATNGSNGEYSRAWMPSKSERGLSGKDLATHLRDACGYDVDDHGQLMQPTIRLFPRSRPRANPSRRARASARMNERHLYGDQLTAPGRITVHSVFGHDHRSMLVQGHGMRRGDRFYFQTPDAEASARSTREALESVPVDACVGGIAFYSVTREELFRGDAEVGEGESTESGRSTPTDAEAFAARFPDAPVAGMLTTGEIFDRALVAGDDSDVASDGGGGVRISELSATFVLFTKR